MYNHLIISALIVMVLELSKNSPGLCVYRRANISVFQALVFALFVFSDFFIFCGANAGK